MWFPKAFKKTQILESNSYSYLNSSLDQLFGEKKNKKFLMTTPSYLEVKMVLVRGKSASPF